jgi:uncharacterized protein
VREIITEATFHPSGEGYRLFILHRPTNDRSPKRAILHVHPFAEEMNKSRRAVSQTARALAGRGWWVLQHDLLGCGDSSGDFGGATWEAWIEDILSAYHWLADRSGAVPVLWGLRLGCLLAANAAERMGSPPNVLLWQPVLSGRSFLSQFLRLKVAESALAANQQAVSTKGLLQSLKDGVPLSVAGYRLPPALALPMEQTEFRVPKGGIGEILLCELATDPENKNLSHGLTRKVSEWQEAGSSVRWETVDDLPFWQTQEIVDCPGFRSATLRLLATLPI